MSELGVSSEIEQGRFAYLGFKRKRTDQLLGFPLIRGQQGTQGCSRGYDCSAATSDDASTTTPSEYGVVPLGPCIDPLLPTYPGESSISKFCTS